MLKLDQMPVYEKYKDSGVEWVGKVPAEWEVKRFRDYFLFSKGLGITKDDLQDEGIPCVSYGEIHSRCGFEVNPLVNRLKCVDLSYDKENHKSLLYKGDFVFADTSEDIEGSGNFTQLVVKEKVFAGYHTVIARPKGDNYKRYLAYLLESIAFRNQIRSFVKGVKVYSITNTILKKTFLILPSLKEQTAIANFLDTKTALIDQAISIKEKQIELLKERKQIVIQNAVTRGLDPNVPMKDSGVDWIGEIPEHWEVKPGFTVFVENKDSNKGMIESTVLSLSYGNIIIKPEEKLTGLVPESFETYQIVKPGDIIIRCTDLQNDKTSLRTGIVKNIGIITSAYLDLRISNYSMLPEYAHFFLHVLDISKAIYKFGSGLRQNLSFNDFKHMSILQPSVNEQKKIIDFITEQENQTVNSVKLLNNQIDKLKEYKTTLINSAVTGKIKVF